MKLLLSCFLTNETKKSTAVQVNRQRVSFKYYLRSFEFYIQFVILIIKKVA